MNRIEEAKEVFAAIYEVPMESPEVLSNVRDVQLSLELAHNVSLANLVKMGKCCGRISILLLASASLVMSHLLNLATCV